MKTLSVAAICVFVFVFGGVNAALAQAPETIHGNPVDADKNGFPDNGVIVTGHFAATFYYDGSGNYFWDFGGGSTAGTVESPVELNQQLLTTCGYVVNYKGKFNNSPGLKDGEISNHIGCSGALDNNQYNYRTVHRTHKQWEEDLPSAGGDWYYEKITVSGQGNTVQKYFLRPNKPDSAGF